MDRRKLKVGVRQGGGVPPGYEWNVSILASVRSEARSFLTEAQYKHLSLQVRDIALQKEPTKSTIVDIKPIKEIYEIRDKGGILGSLNVRLFFGVQHLNRIIVVLGVIHKQNNGPTPIGDRLRMCRRWRKFLSGDYG